MRYRSEIDGLRAVAVIPVILFHAGVAGFPGGFVGVDVFFVLSGYLITTIILTEIAAGRFSILRFYERRARRILPALYFVMAVSLPVAAMLMLPDELRSFCRTAGSVLLFASNIYFWKTTDYFAPDTAENPLLHTWSSAVEEHYYLVVPPVLMLLWRLGRPRLALAILAGTVASLGLAELGWRLRPIANFYLLPTRAWELGLGSLSAVTLLAWPSLGVPGRAGGIAALLGLGMIGAAVAVFNDSTPFPSLYALLPTLGTVLVILFAHPATLAGGLLSLRPAVFIGLISYSAYLWHQPLFAFARIALPSQPGPGAMLALSAAALGLAALTWRFVEQPFRDRSRFGPRAILSCGLAASAGLAALAFVLPALDRPSEAYPPHLQQIVAVSHAERTAYVNGAWRAEMRPAFADDARPRLLLVGDSFSRDFFNMVRETGAFPGYQIAGVDVPARCQIYLGDEDVRRFIDPSDRAICARSRTAAALPLAREADVIVFAAEWKPWAAERLPRTLAAFGFRPDQRVIVIGRKNLGAYNVRAFLGLGEAELPWARSRPEEVQGAVDALMRRGLPDAVFVDTEAILCGAGPDCPLFTPGGELISHDGDHLTRAGARFLGARLFQDPRLAPFAPEFHARR